MLTIQCPPTVEWININIFIPSNTLQQKGWITTAKYNMDESYKHNFELKKLDIKKYNVLCHLIKVHKQAKLIHDIRSQNNGFL